MDDLVKDLETRFPYQFSGSHLGIEVAGGWAPVFKKLCEDVDAVLGQDKRGFHWRQVKEKWGSARFYFWLATAKPVMRLDLMSGSGAASIAVPPDAGDQTLSRQILKLTMAAERATRNLCAVCGRPGAVDATHGWHLALCDEHVKACDKGARPEVQWFVFNELQS